MDMYNLMQLRNVDVPRFKLKGHETYAKVLSVQDGDTCDVAFYLDGKLFRFACRLEDYDAPELEGETLWEGQLARDRLAILCTGNDPDDHDENSVWTEEGLQEFLDESNNLVYAIFGKWGLYARAAVTLKTIPTNESINDMMSDYVSNLIEESSDSSYVE